MSTRAWIVLLSPVAMIAFAVAGILIGIRVEDRARAREAARRQVQA